MGDTVVQIAVRDPRTTGKAHRRAPGAAGQATACGRPTFTLTESVPLTQTAPEDRCTFCWSGDAPPAAVVELASQDVPVGRDHPATSHTAAEMMRPHVSRLRQVVLGHVAATGGSTVDEVQAATGGIHQSTSAAASWLERRGFIQPRILDSGKPETRPTRSGRPARVMVLTRKGQRALGAADGPE